MPGFPITMFKKCFTSSEILCVMGMSVGVSVEQATFFYISEKTKKENGRETDRHTDRGGGRQREREII